MQATTTPAAANVWKSKNGKLLSKTSFGHLLTHFLPFLSLNQQYGLLSPICEWYSQQIHQRSLYHPNMYLWVHNFVGCLLFQTPKSTTYNAWEIESMYSHSGKLETPSNDLLGPSPHCKYLEKSHQKSWGFLVLYDVATKVKMNLLAAKSFPFPSHQNSHWDKISYSV